MRRVVRLLPQGRPSSPRRTVVHPKSRQSITTGSLVSVFLIIYRAGFFMHVLIAGLYGVTIWFCLLATAVMLRGNWTLVLWLGPVIICASMAFLWVVDWAVWRAWASLTQAMRSLRAPKTDS